MEEFKEVRAIKPSICFCDLWCNGKHKVKNARVTISHNGVKIHDDLELPNGTPGKHPEGPGPDILYLQGHGNPVVFRNIWVVNK